MGVGSFPCNALRRISVRICEAATSSNAKRMHKFIRRVMDGRIGIHRAVVDTNIYPTVSLQCEQLASARLLYIEGMMDPCF